jgi:N-acetylneuraminic acid mutarotase
MKKVIFASTILVYFALLVENIHSQSWIQKADFGGSGRYYASGFSIGNKGYLGLGTDSDLNEKRDFWEYDALIDTWIKQEDYPGELQERSVGFSIGSKGYIATDQSHSFWEFDPMTNIWNQKADYPGAVVGATTFSIGTKGYIITGEYSRLIWEWDGDTASSNYNTWTTKAPFPPVAGRYAAVGFSIGKKGYLATGTDGFDDQQDLWEWDGDTASSTYNTWAQKSSLPGLARSFAVAFSLGTKGYIGTGFNSWNNIIIKDFWEWDQATNMWTQMTDLPATERQSAVAFSLGNLAYVGTGGGYFPDPNLRDFWEFCDTCFVGTNEFTGFKDFLIYPNPANDHLFVSGLDPADESIAEIFNSLGVAVLSYSLKRNTELKLSALPPGLYLITVRDSNRVYSTKLIIER